MPRYSSAAAAAAAAVQGDGYKPREERGWEEIHPLLDIEAKLMVYPAEEVDGTASSGTANAFAAQFSGNALGGRAAAYTPGPGNGSGFQPDLNGAPSTPNSARVASPVAASAWKGDGAAATPKDEDILFDPPKKRRVGRPPRRPNNNAAANGLAVPSTPKIVPPPPGLNPLEKLTLPKPSFRRVDPFEFFEQKSTGQVRYVDRSMANVGYQESDFFVRPETGFIRLTDGAIEEDLDLVPGLRDDGEKNTALGGSGVGRVEYDMDEQDDVWLAAYNDHRKSQAVEPITREVFEITMTKIEKEWYALEKRMSHILVLGDIFLVFATNSTIRHSKTKPEAPTNSEAPIWFSHRCQR
jgi:NuA3 HAT complex component NTO1